MLAAAMVRRFSSFFNCGPTEGPPSNGKRIAVMPSAQNNSAYCMGTPENDGETPTRLTLNTGLPAEDFTLCGGSNGLRDA